MSETTDHFSPNKSIRRFAPANIAGVGAVTGYGWGRKHVWDGFLLGESAVRLTKGLEGYVDGGEAYLATITDEGDRRDGPSRFMQALRFAAREAITDATERGWKPGKVVGVVHSIVLGDAEMWSDYYHEAPDRVRVKRWVNMLPSTVISQLMKENDFHGPAMSVSAMCASANAGMITAKSWLDSGIATDVILLATDLSGIPINLRRFKDLGVAVLDTPPLDACRPFQEGSTGFVGGDAAVAPDMNELERCFREALESSGVDASEVAYINAHGPGTAQCDAAEAKMLDKLFPEAAGIFSIKPLVGHCQAAGAAVEVMATIYAYQTGYIPAPPQVAPGHPRLVNGLTPRRRRTVRC